MTKKDNGDFMNCTKCWIYDNAYVIGDIEVRDHCNVTENRSSAHRVCNVKVNLY